MKPKSVPANPRPLGNRFRYIKQRSLWLYMVIVVPPVNIAQAFYQTALYQSEFHSIMCY